MKNLDFYIKHVMQKELCMEIKSAPHEKLTDEQIKCKLELLQAYYECIMDKIDAYKEDHERFDDRINETFLS